MSFEIYTALKYHIWYNVLPFKIDFCKKNGQEVYEILSSLGYEISENKMINRIGESVTSAVQVPVIIAIVGCCPSCVGLHNYVGKEAHTFQRWEELPTKRNRKAKYG